MKKRVLVIEDDPDISLLIKNILTSEGFDVTVANDGVSGLNIAQNENPDLITLDIQLPELNGFTICSLLKNNEKYCNIPIVIITGRSNEVDKVFDDSVKPDGYLTKPFTKEVFIEKINELIK